MHKEATLNKTMSFVNIKRVRSQRAICPVQTFVTSKTSDTPNFLNWAKPILISWWSTRKLNGLLLTRPQWSNFLQWLFSKFFYKFLTPSYLLPHQCHFLHDFIFSKIKNAEVQKSDLLLLLYTFYDTQQMHMIPLELTKKGCTKNYNSAQQCFIEMSWRTRGGRLACWTQI